SGPAPPPPHGFAGGPGYARNRRIPPAPARPAPCGRSALGLAGSGAWRRMTTGACLKPVLRRVPGDAFAGRQQAAPARLGDAVEGILLLGPLDRFGDGVEDEGMRGLA